MKKKLLAAAVLVPLVALLAYLPVFRVEFLWDDVPIQTEQAPALGLRSAVLPGPNPALGPGYFYRPAVLLSYLAQEKLNHAFMGDPGNPTERLAPAYARIPHAVTLFFHLLASTLLLFFAYRLLRPRFGEANGLAGAAAAALLFALHPVHAESVILISGRTDSMAATFLLASLLAALADRERPRPALPAAAGLLFFLALSSKEAAAVGVVLLPLTLATGEAGRAEGRRSPFAARALAPFLAAGALYLVLRLSAGTGLGDPRGGTPAEAAYRFAAAAGWYLRNLVLPWPVTPYAPELPGAAATAAVLAAALAALCAAVRRHRSGDAIPLYGLAFLAVSLAPSLAVALRNVADAPVAQRYLYLPSIGLALCVGALLAAASARRKIAAAALGALLVLSAGVSWSTSASWRTNREFWHDLLKHESIARHALPWINLAQTYLTPETLDEAERFYRTALAPGAEPDIEDRALTWNGLGTVAFNRARLAFGSNRIGEAVDRLAEAESDFSRAIAFALDDYPVFYKNRGEARLMRAFLKRSGEAQWDRMLLFQAGQDLDTAARRMPGDPEVIRLLERWRGYSG